MPEILAEILGWVLASITAGVGALAASQIRRISRLRDEVVSLQLYAAQHYVQRADYVREQSIIEAKIDKIEAKMDRVLDRVMRHGE